MAGASFCTRPRSLHLPVYEYTPMQIKQAVVGYGLAEKRQVMDMTRRLLKLKAVPRPDDAADALAIAICHARSATSLLRRKDPRCKGDGLNMFYYVNGTVAEIGPNLAVIDCGGVGYACATTNYTLSQLKKGERAKLYTYLHVREDIFELYGFSSQAGAQQLQDAHRRLRRRAQGGAGRFCPPPRPRIWPCPSSPGTRRR